MPTKCAQCGELHDEWPAIGFTSPFHYHILSEEDKANIATLTDDICVIKHDTQTDYFIRAVMEIEVKDHCDTLEYGVWVSLSDSSIEDYITRSSEEGTCDVNYFGFLCSQIPGYDSTLSIKTNVHFTGGGQRPMIYLEKTSHPLSVDFHEGISKEEAESRINEIFGGGFE
ncbi:hypothetical protein LX64_03981 [Chitinophaga skermanii]|uniref:DUF2199 domain-containing protein n=1 Tax=Chitinophaga skermanii TaxID=331697 RepID=A0A327Q716_9BACT|nr:DUF2199 domain-containing protein [Chitinophaga skermanii]RAJ00279.1 hypothetical protein LX64_03981 [Chitinophaga skermanii]